jgi:hypothetical protein
MSASIRYTLAVLLLAGSAVSAAPPAQGDAKSRAQAFARSFYDWYTEAGQDRNVEVVLLLKKDVFTPELYEALKADAEVTSKAEGELVGLDFDPFLNAQEAAYTYELGEAVEQAGDFRIPIYGHWGNQAQPQKHHDLTAQVRCAADGCRFVNFHYPKSKLLLDRDLASVLKALAQQRAIQLRKR